MKTYHVVLDMNASLDLDIEAESYEDAQSKLKKMLWDEDAFIDEHRKEIFAWNPEIYEIIEEDE